MEIAIGYLLVTLALFIWMVHHLWIHRNTHKFFWLPISLISSTWIITFPCFFIWAYLGKKGSRNGIKTQNDF